MCFNVIIGKIRRIKSEPRSEKTGRRGFRQIRHKPGCTATEDG